MMNAAAAAVDAVGLDDDGFVRHGANDELMYGTSGGGDGTTAAAVHAALRTVAALVRRDRTGEGAFLDAAGADAVIAQGWIGAVYGWNEDRGSPTAPGCVRPARRRSAAPRYQYYATSDDRFVLFCAIEPKFWQRFCAAVDRPDLAGDPRAVTTPAGRLRPRRRRPAARARSASSRRDAARVARAGDRASTCRSGPPTKASPRCSTTTICGPSDHRRGRASRRRAVHLRRHHR